jgi:hypothetical protein
MSNVESYANRSDLRNPAAKIARQAAKGQTYGEATRQMEAQRAVPMGASPAQVEAQKIAERARPRPVPGEAGDLFRASENNRPITDGADFGPGRNAMQAGIPKYIAPQNPVMDELQMIYSMYPNDDLADLISAFRDGGI